MRIPEYFEFMNSVKILSGKNALENIPFELKNLEAKRTMVLTNQMLLDLGITEKAIAGMKAENMDPCCIYADIPNDSSVTIVNGIKKLYIENDCDSLLAIGGGSVIDTAKGVRMLLSQNCEDLLQLQGCEAITKGRHIPFIVVPTTAGTGSEATLVAVIANTEKNIKMEFISYNLLPDSVILDERMTLPMPPKLTASTGLDALSHAIEAYTCLQSNPISSAFATIAVELISNNLINAINRGNDAQARLAMANASLMAGIAFSNSMVGIVHAIGHACGGVAHVPHGDAMTILLPHCMEYNLDYCGEDYGKLLLYFAGEDKYVSTPKAERGKAFIACVADFINEANKLTGIPTKLSSCGVTEDLLEQIAKTALNDGAMIVNPREAGYDDVVEILKKAL